MSAHQERHSQLVCRDVVFRLIVLCNIRTHGCEGLGIVTSVHIFHCAVFAPLEVFLSCHIFSVFTFAPNNRMKPMRVGRLFLFR